MTAAAPLGPRDAPSRLWALQQSLMRGVEGLLGARDRTKELCQPVFGDDGPVLVNTPDLNGCFARLSLNAAGYWPTAAYELAHETVHLLDPGVGFTHYLEEGVAVHFSLKVWDGCNVGHPLQLSPSYAEALALVREIDPEVFPSARRLREAAGSLRAVSAETIERVLPGLQSGLVHQLMREFRRED
jgi:hypothetical protein